MELDDINEDKKLQQDKEKTHTRNTLRSTTFKYDEDDSGINVTRLSVSIVDFDWVFQGENATNFMKLLGK